MFQPVSLQKPLAQPSTLSSRTQKNEAPEFSRTATISTSATHDQSPKRASSSAPSHVDGIFGRGRVAVPTPMERQRLTEAVSGLMNTMNLQSERTVSYFGPERSQKFQHNGLPAYICQRPGESFYRMGFSTQGQSRIGRLFNGGAGQYEFIIRRETNAIEQTRGRMLSPSQMISALEDVRSSM